MSKLGARVYGEDAKMDKLRSHFLGFHSGERWWWEISINYSPKIEQVRLELKL